MSVIKITRFAKKQENIMKKKKRKGIKNRETKKYGKNRNLETVVEMTGVVLAVKDFKALSNMLRDLKM